MVNSVSSSSSRREQHKLARSLQQLAVAPEQQEPAPQREHRRPHKTQLQRQYHPSNGRAYGGQTQQGHGHNYSDPPPAYETGEHGNPNVMQSTPSNSTEKPTNSKRGFSQSNPFHHDSMKYPQSPAPSAAGTSHYGGDDELSEVASTHSDSKKHRPGSRRPKSKSAMPDSGYESDRTVRGGPKAGAPAPGARGGGYERSGGRRRRLVTGSVASSLNDSDSDTASVTDSSSDTESVSTTASDGADPNAMYDAGYGQGYEEGYDKGCIDGSMAAAKLEMAKYYNEGWEDAMKQANRGGRTDEQDYYYHMGRRQWPFA